MNWEEWLQAAADESIWRDRIEKGLVRAEYVKDYVLRLSFDDDGVVSTYELDFCPLIVKQNPGEVFRPLRDQDRFKLVLGDYALIWLNPETKTYDEKSIDIAPECIRFFCLKYGKKLDLVDDSKSGNVARKDTVAV